MTPTFFETPDDFRGWLEGNHATATELWVGFYKVGSQRQSITWPQAVDEALCVGWIDAVRKSLGAESYMIRFTPRKAGSNWSAVNIGRVAELRKDGRMKAAGEAAFARRTEAKSGVYSYEQREHAGLDAESEKAFRAQREAWKFWEAQAPWYRRTASWWVVSAKRAETRQKRLATLIEDSAAGRTLKQLTRDPKPKRKSG